MLSSTHRLISAFVTSPVIGGLGSKSFSLPQLPIRSAVADKIPRNPMPQCFLRFIIICFIGLPNNFPWAHRYRSNSDPRASYSPDLLLAKTYVLPHKAKEK